MNEEEYRKELAANGVDVPEIPKEEPKKDDEPKPTEEPVAEPKKLAEEEPKKDEEPKPTEEPRKRSVYDDLKEKKHDLKEERAARENAERERDQYAKELEELKAAGGNKNDIQKAQESIEAFAEANKLDPVALKTMRDLFLKDFKAPQSLSDEDRKILEEAKSFVNTNRAVTDKQEFETEFQSALPVLKELFPTASNDEILAIKKQVNVIAHSKDWNVKELDYIMFRNKNDLSKLVSPKKRGIEGKGNEDGSHVPAANFDPNADYSKMSFAERQAWETEYAKLMQAENLVTDAQGRKVLI